MTEREARTADPAIVRRAEIRRAMKALRDGLDPSDVARWGRAMRKHVLDLITQQDFRTIFTYLDVPNEAPTHEIAEALLKQGRRVVVPRVRSGSRLMTLHEITDLRRDVKPGLWRIPTPLKRCPEVNVRDVDVALVPLVAVDRDGYRIGQGGGFYDRFLSCNPHVYAVGIAFEIQRVESCLPQTWDVPLDALITEIGAEVYRRRPRRRR